ncbi:MAG: SprT-like domain-containing protein [Duncaniella sp.]|nr:SprT-like domain-containing protein [Duncaniella sp.]
MKVNKELIEQLFDGFNLRMFGGRLPRVPIVITDARTFLGQCCSKVRAGADGENEHFDFVLKFSNHLDLAKGTVEDTVIHEMIHLFIHYNGLKDTSAHGHLFKALMHSINVGYGRNLTVSHRATPEEKGMQAAAVPVGKGRWHVVALIELNDGKAGIKVLPRTIQRVVMFYRRVLSAVGVKGVRLWLTDDVWFDRYPVSVAMRYHSADAGEVLARLAQARELMVTSDDRLEYRH